MKRGADRLRLEVRPSNKSAVGLYERAGYTPLSLRPAYYADGEDALRMEKSLQTQAQGDRSARR